jgi:hypothetical protein
MEMYIEVRFFSGFFQKVMGHNGDVTFFLPYFGLELQQEPI